MLLLAKLLTFCTFLIALPFKFPQPFVPFFTCLDNVPGELWQRSLQVAYLVAAASLFCNRRVRLSLVVLGISLLLAILSSRLFYSNGRLFCGLVLLLTDLERDRGRPWLLHFQLALTYFGAGLNKVFHPDWRSGQFMEALLNDNFPSRLYGVVAALFPPMSVARIMCWSTIVIELILTCLILTGKRPRTIIWCVLLFHGFVMILTGSFYGIFVPAVATTLFAMVTWPERVDVEYREDSELLDHVRPGLQAMDFDRICHWRPTSTEHWLRVTAGSRTLTGCLRCDV